MSLRKFLTSSRRIISASHRTYRHASTESNTPSAVSAVTGGPPSVMDVIVNLNFVDPEGARRQVPGFVGKTIYETCELHGIDLGPASVGAPVEEVRSSTWTEPLYGEGPTSGFDHILITGKGSDTAKPITWMEERCLQDYWDDDEIFPESRLATQVFLTKDMDGMTVYVPDRLVDDMQ